MKLFYCGDDPQGATGYSIQTKNILSELSLHFETAAFALNRIDESPHYIFDSKNRPPYKIYRASLGNNDDAYHLFRRVFPQSGADVLFLVGDIWEFKGWFAAWLENMQFEKKFKTIGYFSTEYPLSDEEIYILNLVDYPITNSKWGIGFENGAGYDEIKKKVPGLIYIPDSVDETIFKPLSQDERLFNRNVVGFKDDQYIIMSNNRNSARKDIPAIIRAFARVKKEIPKAHLYLHCSPVDIWMQPEVSTDLLAVASALKLTYAAQDSRIVDADISFPVAFTPHHGYPQSTVNQIYNCADLFVSVSISEGFGVPPVEALFAGIPVLIPGHTGFSGICEATGIKPVSSYQDYRTNVAKCAVYPVNEDDLVNRIMDCYNKKDKTSFKLEIDEQSRLARQTFSKTNVIQKYWRPLISDVKKEFDKPKLKEVLLVQHSSGGDVFLSTSVLKGIKERHPGYPITYMTQRQYQDIVSGHPDVNKIIDYNPVNIHDYEIVYKPHEDQILRGNWSAGNVPLAYLYCRLLNVPYNKPLIDLAKPEMDLPDQYIVVHTTSHPYRTYLNFHIALEGAKLPIVQIGSKFDQILGNGNFQLIDLRGKLTYKESAYVIAHSKGFIGIDSFPMHVAGVYDIPSVITFGCGRAAITGALTSAPHVWLEPDYTHDCPALGACSGNFNNCPNPCGRRHNPTMVKKAIKQVFPDLFPDVRKKLDELLARV